MLSWNYPCPGIPYITVKMETFVRPHCRLLFEVRGQPCGAGVFRHELFYILTAYFAWLSLLVRNIGVILNAL